MPDLPAHHVPRPALYDALDEALGTSPVVTVLAPAASGKTTALLGWTTAAGPQRIAYLSLDALDNDPAWFWSRVAAARPEASQPEPTVLVLDHIEAMTNPEVADALGRMLLGLPPDLRVVLSGRSLPELRQGLLRARGQLTEIPATSLDFDRGELATYLGAAVGSTDVLTLHERTEGWIGGVALAALGLADQARPSAYVAAFSGTNGYVADLLRSEVLDPQDAETQDFLLATSVLDSFDAALCDIVTETTTGAVMLERLERSHLFLVREDELGTRFRYRRLFREFLQHELRRTDPDRERQARRAAAEWFENRGDVAAAIGLLVAGGEGSRAARLVLRHSEAAGQAGQVELVRTWLTMLPDEAVTSDVRLLMAISRLWVMSGQRGEALLWLDRVGWRLAGRGESSHTVELQMLRGYLRIQVGQLEVALAETQKALSLAGQVADMDQVVLARVHHLLGAVYSCLDDMDSARRHRELAPLTEETDLPLTYSAWVSYRTGNLSRAIEQANEQLARNRIPWLAGAALVARAAVRRERQQLDEAETDLHAAIELSRRWGRPLSGIFAAMELAELRWAQGRGAEADELLRDAAPLAEGPNLRQRLEALRATLWLRQGDTDRATRLREDLSAGAHTALLDVRLALAAGDLDRAIDGLGAFGLSARTTADQISVRLLQTRARVTLDEPSALDHLRAAVELGRDEGFVFTLRADMDEVVHLLRRLAGQNDDPYLFSLLAAVAGPGPEAPAAPRFVEPLSTREQIVLRYLPTGLSNRDIAAELHVSVNTLKTHLKNINRKLGARSRVEAVAAARSLQLF